MGREAFITDSGRMTDYEFTVTDAYFATVPGYRDGTDWFLHWVGTTDSESQPIMDRDGYHPSWRLGDGWESIDGGKTVTHPTKSHFNRQAPAGELIDALADITSDDEGNPVDPDPLEGADPVGSEWYIGMKFKMGEKVHTYNIDGQERKVERAIPAEYLGKGDVAAPAAAPAAEAAAAPAGASAKVAKAKLTALAKKSGSFADFEEAALSIDGVVDDGDLLENVLDESDSGFYATARS